MAKKKVSGLPTASTLDRTETLMVIQNSQNKKTPIRSLDSLPVSSFVTSLTFDYDKDLATVSGGTRTFTLASSGNLNGVGIIARINNPVAVNFPANFEAVNGSDSISTTSMNIILMRYFSNYDGAGNDKVLYTVKNQTSV